MRNSILTSIIVLMVCSAAYALPGKDGAISGKLFFSNQPMLSSNAGSKTVFSSAEFIYARLELNGTTLKDAFKLKEPGKGYLFLQCRVSLFKEGSEYEYGGSGRNYLLIKDDEIGNSALNFDVLPEPNKATTLFSLLDDFSAGYGFFPFYNTIVQEKLKEGKYKVRVRLYAETQDSWGTYQPQEKWPVIEEEFEFNFRDDDVARILKNGVLAYNIMEENAFRYDKLPPVFSNPGKLTDPNATTAKVAAILKRDLPQRAILKFVAEQYSGTLWHIAKDDYGLPRYKYFNPHIWLAYKADGKCYVGYVTLRQVYSGGGKYGPLEVAWTSTKDDKGIDCVKVK